jgi:hypothetical protein
VTSYPCTVKSHAAKGPKRGHKTGPGRGRHHDEPFQDAPPRLMNRTMHASLRDDSAKVAHHPSHTRMHRRLSKKLRGLALGREHAKVMGSMHKGRDRVRSF